MAFDYLLWEKLNKLNNPKAIEEAKKKSVSKARTDDDIPFAVNLDEDLADKVDDDKLDLDFDFSNGGWDQTEDPDDFDYDGLLKELRVDVTNLKRPDHSIGVIVTYLKEDPKTHRVTTYLDGLITYVCDNSNGTEITDDDKAIADALGIRFDQLDQAYDLILKEADEFR